MKAYIRLARPTHAIKNILVLLPLLCSGQCLEPSRLLRALLGFCAFSLLSSAVYVMNDIRDRKKDRRNPSKCTRPIAAGVISVPDARRFCLGLLLLALVVGYLAAGSSVQGWLAFVVYFLLNLGYSFGLKNVPLLDVAILASGFLLRMLYGGAVTGIEISHWLYLTVMAASFYLGLGKRRNERRDQKGDTRLVLQYYSEGFLTGSMQMCLTLAVLFYALWTVDGSVVARVGADRLIWTVPLVILVCMKYSMAVEGESDGDPVEVLFHDRILLLLVAVLAAVLVFVIY